ncbi:MAG: hybrid sensor histidine kinase/response regulator [Candidatus Omnitrophica bacterium]|nr:hybrid sensor histidine kinase/response regulator [Candidatus Omnitrophota bacterium]
MPKQISVVILDDEQNVLNALMRLFKDEPFGVAVTTDHAGALSLLEKETIKVVVSDHRMPAITGIEFLKMVKERYPDIMRILITGHVDLEIAEDAINKGEVYRFINKPWDDSALKITIRDAIDKFDLTEKIKVQNKELIELNAKLRNMYEAQKEFSSTVSHELRTPLASIKTAIDVVISETPGKLTDDQKNFLNRARSNVDRLNRLVNDVLSLSKLESGKAALELQLNDIGAIIKEAADIQEPVARQKGLHLAVHVPQDMPKVYCDADKINQVLDNLIGNAIKFTDKGGIKVSSMVECGENGVVVTVKDTGPGIGAEDIPKLFQKFQQLGNHATRQTGGTGLGLAICKEIIARHGGKIWVESESGKGSAFSFLLPIEERRKNG